MRDIEFRIWEKENHEMIEDVKIYPEYGWLVMSDNDALAERGRYNPNDLIWMQYTGLTDKNGKKIFEGDIVLINNKHTDEVIFECGCFLMKKQLFDYEFTYQNFDDLEVIGNIYENKELLGD